MFKTKKNNLNIFIYLFLLLSLIILIIYKTPGLKGGIDQEIRILTNNPIILDGRFPLKESIPNIKIAIKDFFTFKKKNFENLKIDMTYLNYNKLKTDREKALKLGMLENPTRVNMNLFWNGEKISASGRLKGDFNDHRNFNKQWSFKLNLKNSNHINGMTEFSITNHRSRNFPYNFIISKNLQRMGLNVPLFQTVKVNFNGYDWGIMLIEEHFTKEFLENRKLKNTLIFKLSNEEIMKFQHLFLYKNIITTNEYQALTKWQDKLNVYYHNQRKLFEKKLTFERKDFINKLSLMKSLNELVNIKGEKTSDEIIEKYFDLKSFAIMLVSSLAWGEAEFHSMELNNVRFYINPYTLKVTPIPADYEFIFLMRSSEKSHNRENRFVSMTNALTRLPPIYHAILKNDNFQDLYLETLIEFQKNIKHIKDDTNDVCSNYNEICNKIVKLEKLQENLSYLMFYKKEIFQKYKKTYQKKRNSENIFFNNFLKENNLNQARYFNLHNEHIFSRVFSDGTFRVINLTNSKINIDSIEIGKANYKKKLNLKVDESKFNELNIEKLNLDFNPKTNSIVKINYSFNNNTDLKTYKTYVEDKIDLLDQNSKYYNFEKNNILIKENDIIFEKRDYIINEPILVPENHNLIIQAGANLKFSTNSNIFVNNGSIKILGEKNNTINLTALNNNWGGIHVIGSKEKSIIEYSKISKINYFKNSKFNLTGAINFYNANVEINNSIFEVATSEDLINFIKSNFLINNTNFLNAKSDGIDSDYSIGKIKNSKFTDINGDAIDTSGSEVTISNVKITNVGDKGVSVGEQSTVKISNTSIDNSKIGIASKDSSKVFANNLNIKNSTGYDLASYNKKKIYGGGMISVNNINSDNKFLSQINSLIKVNDSTIPEKKFNVKDLY